MPDSGSFTQIILLTSQFIAMKLKSLFTVFFNLSLVTLTGQLELNTSGNVGIGITPSASEKLYAIGDIKFGGNVGIGSTPSNDDVLFVQDGDYVLKVNDSEIEFWQEDEDASILFKHTGSEPAFLPYWNNCGSLGSSTLNFYCMYTRYLKVNGVYVSSDIRLKDNIRALINPLEKIQNIRGVKFDFINTPNSDFNDSKNSEIQNMSKDRIGFIAQELTDVYPELVKYDVEGDQYSVDYIGMIPILLEAIKEQQVIIEGMKSQIENISELQKSLLLSEPEELKAVNNCILYQNSPNPFSEKTTIRYNLSDDVTNADIIIYDMTGKQLRKIPLTETGKSSVSVSGGEMDPGMYMYCMIVDNQLIDTKQIILTE